MDWLPFTKPSRHALPLRLYGPDLRRLLRIELAPANWTDRAFDELAGLRLYIERTVEALLTVFRAVLVCSRLLRHLSGLRGCRRERTGYDRCTTGEECRAAQDVSARKRYAFFIFRHDFYPLLIFQESPNSGL